MKRRFFFVLLGAALLAPTFTTAAEAVRAGGVTSASARIVFQVNDEDSRKWHTVLANVNNVQEELGKVEVAVVVIGPALGMLKADALTANKVLDAMSAGVRFVACGNSMTALKLDKDDMIDRIDYARAGYVEIMRLQQQGWTYLRP